ICAIDEVLEDHAINKSSKSISERMTKVLTIVQVLKENGEVIEVTTDLLEVGNIVIVLKGEQIPIDGITDRKVMVNESALTGESLPVSKDKDEEVFAGTINEGNVFYLEVNKLSKDTIFSNII